MVSGRDWANVWQFRLYFDKIDVVMGLSLPFANMAGVHTRRAR